jgi:plasmid stability protein
MADLNLRKLPEWLIKRLKVQAAERDLTLRAHCIELLAGIQSQQTKEWNLARTANAAVLLASTPLEAQKPQGEDGGARLCRSCERPLRSVKGKFACCQLDCGMCGLEQ